VAVNVAQLDDERADRALDHAGMGSTARTRLALIGATLLAACGATPGAPTPGPTAPPASNAPAPTGTAAPAASLAVAVAGAPSISSILGASHLPPVSTTWTRISDAGAPFTYEVPSTWTGHAAYPWEEGGQAVGVVLAAGPDPSKLSTDFSVPGIAIGLSANPGGLTAHQVVEADNSYGATCTASGVQDTTDSGATASFQLWESCAGGTGYLLVMAIVPAGGQGLVAIIFQGVAEADLGYLDHIAGSLQAATTTATPAPAATPGQVSGQTYTISMDDCHNQHGQGIAAGLIRNDDTLVHTFRIVVAFSDPNNVLLNDTWGTTPDIPPGITARWQAVVPSGLPAVTVSCRITGVELVN